VSRKDARKQERSVKKQRKAEFYAAGAKRHALQDHPDSPERKRAKIELPAHEKPQPKPANAAATARNAEARVAKVTTKKDEVNITGKPKAKRSVLQNLVEKGTPAPFPRSRIERDEDAYIARLEAKLGLGKGGVKGKSKGGSGFEDDGLDGAWSFLSDRPEADLVG
jgi:nucleolar MIF4G domain-containing protein 1